MSKMPISEIFYSLQGEGRNTGVPVIFVRFRGCNLKCKWCDSKYARHKDHISEINMMTLEDVVAKIESFNCEHIVFTGGEPSLFEAHIDKIYKALSTEYYLEIETNGARELELMYDQVNVSYKFKSSGNDYPLMAIQEDYDYKFVVDTKEDLDEMEELIALHGLPKQNIFLMPLGTTEESQDRMDLARYCVENGYRYSPRQHIGRFGNKRGV